MITIWKYICETLSPFEKCFSRKAAYCWFVVIVIGLMIRTDNAGVTSIIRELCLSPHYYEAMLCFFRAKSWRLLKIIETWTQIVVKSGLLYTENDMPILVGDGVKQYKEGRKMPCVKRHHQESENSSKAITIFGHMFGAVGILLGNTQKKFCVPLSIKIHDGNEKILFWQNPDEKDDRHIVKMIKDASSIIMTMGRPAFLLLDRYFLSVPALMAADAFNSATGSTMLTIVTKAKSNCVAYQMPQRKPGRGRPPMKGEPVKLLGLFDNINDFTRTSVTMYGKDKEVLFLCKDLLWGKQLYQKLRFVLVICNGVKSILVCTDTSVSAEQIIRLYSFRFKIETTFRELKQIFAGFSYHFWSKAMPKLNRFQKSGEDALNNVTEDSAKHLITDTYNAIQGFVMFSGIAMGIVQMCSLSCTTFISSFPTRWVRTVSNSVPSEALTVDLLRKSFSAVSHLAPDLPILRFIRDRQSHHSDFPLAAGE